MIFDRYDPSQIEFAYQVSSVLSLSILTKFYGLELTNEQKDKLVDGLALIGTQDGGALAGDGSFLPEIPSLVFCLHLLQTETNRERLAQVVNSLSSVYLMAIGERIDALSVSSLLCAWSEVGMTSHSLEEGGPFTMLRNLVIEKSSEDAFFSKGCGTALVNILKASNEMNIDDSQFLDCILDGLHDRFADLDIPWATICLKNMS